MTVFSCLWQYLHEFFLEGETLQIKVVEKVKIHILCPITFFSEKPAVYDMMMKNVVEPERPQMTI